MSARQLLKRLPVVRDIAAFIYRSAIAIRQLIALLGELLVWLFRSRETTNFTYHLTPLNQSYLAAMVAGVTGKPYPVIAGYIAELENDRELSDHIVAITHQSEGGAFADAEARYARRAGWYAFTRALKPKVVVETGVDKGLGSCVLTAALRRNTQEGYPGQYFGTDINPGAGYLFTAPYRQYGTILYGDSITSLEKLDQSIDLFINDSDHSVDYEAREYQAIAGKLNSKAVLLGDNAHITGELLKFALATGRQFTCFYEKPSRHWYPGAAIGIAYKKE